MLTIEEVEVEGYEKVIEGKDPSRALHCFIAVHNTALGPALGGTRVHRYPNPEDALQDVLKLARAMTYKSAVVQSGLGGGKSVIIADPFTEKTEETLTAFAEVLDSLAGLYIAAEDVGSSTADMNFILQHTPYVAATSKEQSSGDPSPYTAWGVFRGIQATAQKLFHSSSLKDKTIAIQGLGNVGGKLANLLFWHGAKLIVSDINTKHVRHCIRDYHATPVEPIDFCKVECDILAPCAFGGIINDKTIEQLKCKAVAGGANNQLASPVLAEKLAEKGILYAPDYIINAGGLINAAMEYEINGYDPIKSRNKTDRIFDLLLEIYERAEKEKTTTVVIANQIAEFNLKNGIGKRKNPIYFNKKASV